MPSVELILSNPQVTFGNGEYTGREGWRLSFDAHISNTRQRLVYLTTKEGRMNNLEGAVTFLSASTEAFKGFEKGCLIYWKEMDDEIFQKDANYLVSLRMTDDDIFELIEVISGGVPLSSVILSFSEEDMFVWSGGDYIQKWDNENKPALEIQGFRLLFGKHEQRIIPDPPEPMVNTDAEILAAVRETSIMMRYIIYALYALVGLLVALVIR